LDRYECTINVSILEIYNETIRDLLAENVGDRQLSVKQGPQGMYVPDLTMVPVESLDEVALIRTLTLRASRVDESLDEVLAVGLGLVAERVGQFQSHAQRRVAKAMAMLREAAGD
jgi:hypothetical protein